MAREYGTSVETTASPDQVWRIWSDMSTWDAWNPNVSTMDWKGGFVSGSTGVMNTRAGQHHKMQPDGRGWRPARASHGRHVGSPGGEGLRHPAGQPGRERRVR